MKKHKTIRNLVVVFLIAAMSVFAFIGCQSKNKKNNVNGQQVQNGGFNSEARKQQIQNDVNTLVTDGTITKDQGDKILEALTTNGGGFGGNSQRRQNNGQNNNQNNGQNARRVTPLSKLVSDGTITQAQADAVMEKIRGNFQRPQNNNQNNNQTTNQS